MKTSAILTSILTAFATQAGVFDFDLQGRAGFGLLSGNELHNINGTPGSGGETGLGISYDDASNILTINIGWGSGNGFTDLTGNATAGHIHGLTAGSAPTSFTQTASVRYGLDSLAGWNNSAANGGFVGTVAISESDEAALLAGQMYINVHTSSNGPGEIRGQLTPVPEPGETVAAVSVALGLFAVARRFRSSVKA
jgi:hypothetical protein